VFYSLPLLIAFTHCRVPCTVLLFWLFRAHVQISILQIVAEHVHVFIIPTRVPSSFTQPHPIFLPLMCYPTWQSFFDVKIFQNFPNPHVSRKRLFLSRGRPNRMVFFSTSRPIPVHALWYFDIVVTSLSYPAAHHIQVNRSLQLACLGGKVHV